MFTSAYEVYKEITLRGLHLRKENGRDNQLYDELKVKLKCPPEISVEKYLKEASMSAMEFVKLFMSLSEPFSEMYQEIYRIMKTYQAKRANDEDSMKIECEFVKDLHWDLKNYKVIFKIEESIRIIKSKYYSTFSTFYALHDFFGALHTYKWERSVYEDYIPTPPTTSCQELNQQLALIYDLFMMIDKDRKDRTYIYSLDKEKFNDYILTIEDIGPYLSVLGRYKEFVVNFKDDRANIKQAVKIFTDVVLPSLIKEELEEIVIVEKFLEYLNLPFWRNRWYLYEVWITLWVIKNMEKYHISLNVDQYGNLPLKSGAITNVGEFYDVNGTKYKIIAQYQTNVTYDNRKGIQPDLRIVRSTESEPMTRDEIFKQTIAIIECKQRQSMAVQLLMENAKVYEAGAPNSSCNIFVNYDEFPDIDATYFAKTKMLSNVRPKNDQHFLIAFEEAISSLNPPRKLYEALLIDISLSMDWRIKELQLDLNDITNQLNKVITRWDIPYIFTFGNELKVLNSIEGLKFTDRGSNLEGALMDVHSNYEVKNILMLSDGEYAPKPLPDFLTTTFKLIEIDFLLLNELVENID